MFKTLSITAGALIAAATLVPSAASAQGYHGDGYYGGGGYYQPVQYRYRRGDVYRGPRGGYYGRPAYRGRPYYGRGCRDSGTGGTIIGAIAGGLLGHEIADGPRRDGTVGALVASGVGALAGPAIDRDC